MLPSVKTLREVFGDNAKQARAVLEMSLADLLQTVDGAARVAECYHMPATSDIRMHVLDTLAGTHGVEWIDTRHGGCAFLNAGDPYVATLVYFRGRYRVTTWGDIAERYATEEN